MDVLGWIFIALLLCLMLAVLTYLTQYDCITFYTFVSTLKTTESAMKSGGWVLLDSAETLFLTARDRVFSNMENSKKKGKTGDKESLFEENPKWTEIGKVIEEITKERQRLQRSLASKARFLALRPLWQPALITSLPSRVS